MDLVYCKNNTKTFFTIESVVFRYPGEKLRGMSFLNDPRSILDEFAGAFLLPRRADTASLRAFSAAAERPPDIAALQKIERGTEEEDRQRGG